MRLRTSCIACALALAMSALLPARAAIPTNLPPAARQGAVKYLSGGTSWQRTAAMQRAAARYPLELEFLESGRAYAASPVAVTIRDRTGAVVFDATADAPLMLLALPDGRYLVSARHAGRDEVLHADVERGRRTTLAFDWKACANAAEGC